MNETEMSQIARRRRVNELVEAIADAIHMTKEHLDALKEFEISATDGIGMALDRIKDPLLRQAFDVSAIVDSERRLMRADVDAILDGGPMPAVLARLFLEAAKLTRPGMDPQSPALECIITLSSGNALQGVISPTPEGAVRMLAKAHDENNRPILVEHFFDEHEIRVISVRRDVTAVPAIWVPAPTS